DIHRLPHFFANEPATTEIYTLSLHDALPIYERGVHALDLSAHLDRVARRQLRPRIIRDLLDGGGHAAEIASLHVGVDVEGRLHRSEEHTSELQSLAYLVCRLLLEKKKK